MEPPVPPVQPVKDAVVQVSESDATTQNEQEQEPTGGFSAFWRIFTFATSLDWFLYAVGFATAIASGTALALVNVIFGGFVTAVTNFAAGTATRDQFLGVINQYALYYVYIAVARFALTYTFTACSNIASTRVARNIRQKYLEATLSQEIAFFDQGQGSVSINLTTNGNLIENGTADRLALTVQALSSFISAFVVAFITQWKLTLITMGIAPGIIIAVGVCVAISAKKEIITLDIHAKAGAFAEDVLGSMRTVHAFWARPTLVNKYTEWLDEGRRISLTKGPIWGIMFSTEFLMVYSGFALAFWQGTHMYARGEIRETGTVATVLFSVVVAATSLTQLAPNVVPITYAASAASALFKTIDRKSEINPFNQDGKQPDTVKGNLEFAQVSFAYPSRPDVPVLENFTLTVPANKVTALVGASGSGKSTVVGLCERFYDPNSGSIKLDGVPVHELNLRWLRTRIRMVQQEPVLLNGTIFENVVHGLVGTQYESGPEDAQHRLVESACKLANAHDFISGLPEGYHTQIGERASMLSGGQKQRIAIARSVISEPSILLLDEATSALDPEAEGIVQAALDKASCNRTTIVIAHKLATVKKADNIVVVSKGRIVEQGTHQSLLEADGTYAQLVRIQDLGKAAEAALEKSERQSDKNLDHEPKLTRYATEDMDQTVDRRSQNSQGQHVGIGIIRAVLALLREQPQLRWHYLVLLIACIAGGIVFPAQAVLFAKLQDVFLLPLDEIVQRGNFFSLMFFIIAIANWLIYFAIGWDTNTITTEMSHRYRREMFDAMLKQDLQFFDRSENTSGTLTSKLSSEPESILELMGIQVGIITIVLINMVSSSVLALVFGWKLGLAVIFSGYPLLILSGYIRWRLEQESLKGTQERNTASASFASEAVGAIRTINSLALESQILQRYITATKDSVRLTTFSTLKKTAWFSVSQSIEFLFLAFGFWYGCRLVANGEYNLQQFYIVFVGVFFSGQAASQLFSYCGSLTKAKAAVNYIFWLRALEPIMSDNLQDPDRSPPRGAKSLRLDNVKFSYPLRPEIQVVRGVSLNIEPGQFVALVGASGCGKTTIVALLERFYDPVTGHIIVDETADIKDLSPRLYRQHLSLVQQEPTLYQGTIRENVALGRRQCDEETDREKSENLIDSALHQANAYDFVASLPQGIDTQVGRSGIQLSGGQRQRIAIARALIRNPDVLLLDEATSALDTESEKIVQAALAQAAKGERITVAVAHRLSTIKEADKICVFMNGKIIEVGKHQGLLDKGGVYAQMCKAQSLDVAV